MTDDTLQTRIRSGEEAYVSVDGEPCWTRKGMTAEQGTPQCGRHTDDNFKKDYDDDSVPVTGCVETFSGAGINQLTVRIWTNLDQNSNDESFGIDNALLQQVCPGVS